MRLSAGPKNDKTCGVSCEPACKPCSPIEPSDFLCCSQKIVLYTDDEGFTVSPAVCNQVKLDLKHLEALVRRRGTKPWTLKYPAWDYDDTGGIVFRIDDLFRTMPLGRYEVGLCHENEIIAKIEVRLKKRPILDSNRLKPVNKSLPYFPEAPMTNFAPECLTGFSSQLCAVLERGSQAILLPPQDMAALCSCQLCKAWEFVIFDGAQQEIVLLTGCQDGNPIFVRHNQQRRFPVGAEFRFIWTVHNVIAAQTPC